MSPNGIREIRASTARIICGDTSLCIYRAGEATLANAKAARPAIEAHGGRFLARGNPVKAGEVGVNQRLVVLEFESEETIEADESREYQAALAILRDAAERDVRMI